MNLEITTPRILLTKKYSRLETLSTMSCFGAEREVKELQVTTLVKHLIVP
jgi:hypothetical protein